MNMSLLARCHHNRINAWTIAQLFTPLKGSLDQVPALVARGNRPLQMTFEDQLKILTYTTLKNILRNGTYCRFSSKRILLQLILPRPVVLKKALFLKLSILVVWNK